MHAKDRTAEYWTVYKVIMATSKLTNHDIVDIMGGRRKADLVRARHLVMAVAADHFKLPLISIGKRMDRDHTSVIHGRDVIRELRKNCHVTNSQYKIIAAQAEAI